MGWPAYLLLGGGFAFAAAIQPGPFQAFLVSRVAATGWKRTLPACLAPLLSDGPIALLVLLVLGRLTPAFQQGLRACGGLLLLYLAGVALVQWRNPVEAAAGGSAPRTLFEAVLVNALNPNAYLGWALVLGPTMLAAWRERPSFAVALVVGFYAVLVATLGGFIVLAGAARWLGPRGRRTLVGVSALLLAGLGVYLLASGLRGLAAA
jgi:threonine/homoserine/homoserine lactone efflux protein